MHNLGDLLLFTATLIVISVLVCARPQENSSVRTTSTETRRPATGPNTNNNARPGENTWSTTLGTRPTTRTTLGSRPATRTTSKPTIIEYANDFENQIDSLLDGYFKAVGDIIKNSSSAQTCAMAVADASNLVVEALKTL